MSAKYLFMSSGLRFILAVLAYLLLVELLTSFYKSLEEADEVLARHLATAILICSFNFFAKRSASSVFPLLNNLVRRWSIPLITGIMKSVNITRRPKKFSVSKPKFFAF
jgi:hypothetical protein